MEGWRSSRTGPGEGGREAAAAAPREAGTHSALPVPRYSAQVQDLDHRCSCCKEERTSERQVTLECPDGSELSHTYTHIESCLCQDTVCALPQAQQVRVRRSSPRLLGRK